MKCTDCNQVQGLVPGYMDGELSEEQAAPLRRHLLSCLPCRSSAQALTNLSSWFSAPERVEVPANFAARVARAAFAEAGETCGQVKASEPPGELRSATVDSDLRSFVLGLTSIAATLLLVLALFMAREKQPLGPELSAEPLPVTLEELDRLNAVENVDMAPVPRRPKMLTR